MPDLKDFVRQADQAFDVVLLSIAWILEDNHIPTLRIPVRIGELIDQDPVSCVRRVPTRGPPRVVGEPARGTDHVLDGGEVVGSGLGGAVITFTRLELNATLFAAEILVASHQGGRHGTGRYHKCLGFKGTKHQRQQDRDQYVFDVVARKERGVVVVGSRIPRRLGHGSAARGVLCGTGLLTFSFGHARSSCVTGGLERQYSMANRAAGANRLFRPNWRVVGHSSRQAPSRFLERRKNWISR